MQDFAKTQLAKEEKAWTEPRAAACLAWQVCRTAKAHRCRHWPPGQAPENQALLVLCSCKIPLQKPVNEIR